MENYFTIVDLVALAAIIFYVRVIKKKPMNIVSTIMLLATLSDFFQGLYWIAEYLLERLFQQNTNQDVSSPKMVAGMAFVYLFGTAIQKIINPRKSELPAPSSHRHDENGRKRQHDQSQEH